MTKQGREQAAQAEYLRIKPLYSEVVPQYIGTLVLSQESAGSVPLDLDEIYGVAVDNLAVDRRRADAFARAYGALSICVALDNAETSFDLVPRGKYLRRRYAEVQTVPTIGLKDTLRSSETDAQFTYILANSNEPQAVEMSLIQALHLLDLAVVTDQFDSTLPNVRQMGVDELLELRQRFPEMYIRTYGNVRGLRNVPLILGTVLSTAKLEKNNIETFALDTAKTIKGEVAPVNETKREQAAFVGITTAKRPHIGHALLVVKAIADSPSGSVLIELNDQGPRVERQLQHLLKAEIFHLMKQQSL